MKVYSDVNFDQDILAIGQKSPLIHNITNYVVMNNTANALLSIGASPVMAHAREEVKQMVGIASALVVNVGTLSEEWVEAMEMAMQEATRLGVPIVYDPVGAGATSYRNQVNERLLKAGRISVIRGNGSEIMALVNTAITTKGVDSTASSSDAVEAAKILALATQAVVVISGATDYIVTPQGEVYENDRGVALMNRVTGMGCTATAVCGAFVAVNPDPAMAALGAMRLMGVAGEMAYQKTQAPGSFQVEFLDSLYKICTK